MRLIEVMLTTVIGNEGRSEGPKVLIKFWRRKVHEWWDSALIFTSQNPHKKILHQVVTFVGCMIDLKKISAIFMVSL